MREQIWFGWEHPLARAAGGGLLYGKYETDGWWSVAAADLVNSSAAARGKRQSERDHVEPVSRLVEDLLAVKRTPAETAALLELRLVTCTVTAEEHRRLAKIKGLSQRTPPTTRSNGLVFADAFTTAQTPVRLFATQVVFPWFD